MAQLQRYSLNDTKNPKKGVVALLEACDVTNNGRHLAHHLGFYQELEIRLRPREMLFFVLYRKNNTLISVLQYSSQVIYFYC